MQQVILLDIDGVVVPNCPLVGQSIERYVARHCNIPLKQARTVNRRLYKNYGHSCTGLQQVYGLKRTLEEFNAEVYQDLPGLQAWLDSLCPKRCTNVTTAVKHFQRMNCSIYSFSNAPLGWCQHMLSKVKLQDSVEVLNPVPYLKPQPVAYMHVSSVLQEAGQSDCQVHFIDDSMQNLLPIVDKPNWTGYLFTNDHNLAVEKSQFHHVDQLSDVSLYL